MTDYPTVLETYTFAEILEMNDISESDVLEFLVQRGYVNLPELLPLEFND